LAPGGATPQSTILKEKRSATGSLTAKRKLSASAPFVLSRGAKEIKRSSGKKSYSLVDSLGFGYAR
jgi:hypothetical protein